MAKSPIEWTDETWNPTRGCQLISPGCRECYAMRQAIRQAGPGKPYEGLVESTAVGPRWTGKIVLDPLKLLEPLHWRKRRQVFVDSMSDLFYEELPDQDIARVYAVMQATPHITYQVLTKRAERMRALLGSEAFEDLVYEAGEGLALEHGWCHANEGEAWPLPNVWQGVSVEDRARTARLEALRATPAAVRFVSFEPLIEDVGEVDLRGIQWAIIGGESGGNSARPCDLEWIRRLLWHCKEAGTAPFVKQLGRHAVDSFYDPARAVLLKHRKGADPTEWSRELQVREFPEVARAA